MRRERRKVDMETEEIYEGSGEVNTTIEGNSTLRSLFDDSIKEAYSSETPSTMHALLQSGVDDDAVVTYIFDSCDSSRAGYVQASRLVDFLSHECGNNNLQELFQQLHSILDPDGLDLDVDVETFQEALKTWATLSTTKESKLGDDGTLSPSHTQALELHKRAPAKNNYSISEYLSASFNSSFREADFDELQHKFGKLQEENKLLKIQMSDVEELITTLKVENVELKSIISRVEQETTDITAKSQHLQEDNGALQNCLEELKEELRKITEAYNECQLELKSKSHELSILEINSSKEEHHCDNLYETIRQLEGILAIKEKELKAKDEDIQRIAEELIEQQMLADHPLKTKEHDDETALRTDTLASELQSSLGTPWKRQMMESALKPDSIHPIAWSAMLNEPEFEDTPKMAMENAQRSLEGSTKVNQKEAIAASADEESTFPDMHGMLHQAIQEVSVVYDGLAHSTPFNKKKLTFEPAPIRKGTSNESGFTAFKILQAFVKLILIISSVGFASLFALMIVTAIASILLSSMPCISGGDGVSHYHQQASELYHTSVWSILAGKLMPYCRIEYYGTPPV